MEHNARPSKTLNIVVAVSLILWLSAFVVFTIKGFYSQCFLPISLRLVNVPYSTSSVGNPCVYSFRLPIFKHILRERKDLRTCFSPSWRPSHKLSPTKNSNFALRLVILSLGKIKVKPAFEPSDPSGRRLSSVSVA